MGRRRTALSGAALAVALLGGTLLLRPALHSPDCRITVRGEEVGLSSAQAQDATTLAAVTRRDGRTQQAMAGVLQEVLDDADGSLTPDAAAALLGAGRTDPAAMPLARALLGYGSERLSCRPTASGVEQQAEGRSGLTPRADRARAALLEAFGPLPLGGFAPGGVRDGHIEGSAHYEGRAVDTFFRPVTERNRQRGWTAAQWAVAHAEELELDAVIFDRRLWSASRAREGWRPYRHPSGNTTNPVLLHLDHVHLDVLEG